MTEWKKSFVYVSPFESHSSKGQNIFEQGLISGLIEIAKNNPTVLFQVFTVAPFFRDIPEAKNVEIYEISASRSLLGHLSFQWKLFCKMLFVFSKNKKLSRSMYVRYHPALIAPLLISILFNTPYVVRTGPVLPNLFIYEKNPNFISLFVIKTLMGCFMRRATNIIVVTQKIGQWVQETFNISSEKIKVVANGVNLTHFKIEPSSRSRWGVANDSTVAGFVGHIYEDQGLEFFIRAMSHLEKNVLDHFQLLIAGDGPELESLKRLAAELGLSKNVVFAGRVPYSDIPKLICSCDYMIAPFTKRTFEVTGSSALKLFESLACNKPLLASRSGDHEFIEKNGLGLLVEPENVEAWSYAIQNFMKAHLSCNPGRDFVALRHSYDRIAEVIYGAAMRAGGEGL